MDQNMNPATINAATRRKFIRREPATHASTIMAYPAQKRMFT